MSDRVLALIAWVVRHSHDEHHDEDGDRMREDAVRAKEQMDSERAQRRELLAAFERVALRNPADGPCFCVVPIPADTAHHLSCVNARAAIRKAKGETT
jgi:hypothetical protein